MRSRQVHKRTKWRIKRKQFKNVKILFQALPKDLKGIILDYGIFTPVQKLCQEIHDKVKLIICRGCRQVEIPICFEKFFKKWEKITSHICEPIGFCRYCSEALFNKKEIGENVQLYAFKYPSVFAINPWYSPFNYLIRKTPFSLRFTGEEIYLKLCGEEDLKLNKLNVMPIWIDKVTYEI